jgi:hypothetical protein
MSIGKRNLKLLAYEHNNGGGSSVKGRDEPDNGADPVEEKEEGCTSTH